jgi:hypothetical protein
MAHIIIDINSDLDPVTYEIETEEDEYAARVALRDAGLAWEDVWVGEPGTPDAHKSGGRLTALAHEVDR